MAPGDTGRELIHEVRNLQQAVVLLTKIALPRDEANQRRRRAIALSAVMTLAFLGLIGYTRYLNVDQTRNRLVTNHTVCERANARGDALSGLMKDVLAINPNDPQAKAFFEPRIKKIDSLREDCTSRYPLEGDPGWPGFWR